jgi:hypothetical protein
VPRWSTACTREDVVPFLPVVEEHEGLTLADSSHAGVFRRELNRTVPSASESVIAQDPTVLLVKAQAATQAPIEAAARTADDQKDGGVVSPAKYHCAPFKYFQAP